MLIWNILSKATSVSKALHYNTGSRGQPVLGLGPLNLWRVITHSLNHWTPTCWTPDLIWTFGSIHVILLVSPARVLTRSKGVSFLSLVDGIPRPDFVTGAVIMPWLSLAVGRRKKKWTKLLVLPNGNQPNEFTGPLVLDRSLRCKLNCVGCRLLSYCYAVFSLERHSGAVVSLSPSE